MITTLPPAARVVGTVTAALALTFSAVPASAAPALSQSPAAVRAASNGDVGLFGAADPTFDGVYRQGLAITGLRSVKAKVPASAITWLVTQQCSNGGFQAYRANTSAPCDAPNPDAFTGPDSNSTALAAMALRSVGRTKQATRATAYLRTLQNSDGGFAYFKGGSSDVNSTGLALAALRPQAGSSAVAKRIKRATNYLRAAQLRCSSAQDRGLLPYQSGGPANSLASAQAALGLTTTLPASARRTSSEALKCRNGQQVGSVSTRNALLAGVSSTLRAGNGTAPSSFGSGPDLSATAQMTIALAAAKQYPGTVRIALGALKRNAADYTDVAKQNPSPAALGTLLQLAAITPNSSPTSFGGVNLTRELRATIRR